MSHHDLVVIGSGPAAMWLRFTPPARGSAPWWWSAIRSSAACARCAGAFRPRRHAGEGFVKVVASAKGRLLGVSAIGAHATQLIAEAATSLAFEASAAELADVVHAHPTLSEAVSEAARAAVDRARHA